MKLVTGSERARNTTKEGGNVHANPRNHICRVPETDVAGENASVGRVPGHDEQVDVDGDVEDDDGVPGAEGGAWQAQAAASVAQDVEAGGHEDVEEGGRVDLCAARIR